MRRGYKVTLGVLAFLIVCCMFVGSSYALWRVTNYQTSTNLVETGCFNVEFKENSSSIRLDKAYPISNEKGLNTTPYIFKLTNNCSIKAQYNIYLNSLNIADGTKLGDQYIRYSLKKTGSSVNITNLLSAATKNTDSNKSYFNTNGKTYDINTSYVLDSGTLDGSLESGKSVEYSLRLWMDSETTIEQATTGEAGSKVGSKFEGNISAIATPINSAT